MVHEVEAVESAEVQTLPRSIDRNKGDSMNVKQYDVGRMTSLLVIGNSSTAFTKKTVLLFFHCQYAFTVRETLYMGRL
jgi:hypothetical protein